MGATSIKETGNSATSTLETVGEPISKNEFNAAFFEDEKVKPDQVEPSDTQEEEEEEDTELEEEEEEEQEESEDEPSESEEEDGATHEEDAEEQEEVDWKVKYEESEKRKKELETYNGHLTNQVGEFRGIRQELDYLKKDISSNKESSSAKKPLDKLSDSTKQKLYNDYGLEDDQIGAVVEVVSDMHGKIQKQNEERQALDRFNKEFSQAENYIQKDILDNEGNINEMSLKMGEIAKSRPDLYLVETRAGVNYSNATAMRECYNLAKKELEYTTLKDKVNFLENQLSKKEKNLNNLKSKKKVKGQISSKGKSVATKSKFKGFDPEMESMDDLREYLA